MRRKTKAPQLAVPGWVVGTRVGSGLAGEVFRVRGKTTDMEGALKVGAAGDARVAEEGALLGAACRRWAPRVLDAGVTEGRPYFVTQWIEGVPLSDVGPASDPERLACVVAHAVGRALAELHELGLRHGDVKPSNILIHLFRKGDVESDTPAGRGATLIDLSLGAALGDDARGGTPRYFSRDGRPGPAADAWALGVVLAEILDPRVRSAKDPVHVVSLWREPNELRMWVAALLGKSPAGVPSMRWIADRAALRLGLHRSADDLTSERQLRVKRTYLAERSREGVPHAHLLTEPLRGWVDEARAWLRSRPNHESAATASPALSPLGRRRWIAALTNLTGASALSAIPELDDSALASRLVALCASLAPEALTEGDLRGRGAHAVQTMDDDPVRVMRALASATPGSALVDHVEARALAGELHSHAEEVTSELVRHLLRCGETGRAIVVLSAWRDTRSVELTLLRAEALRRQRDPHAALAVLSELANSSPRAWGIRARAEWDLGLLEEALASAANAEGAAAAEVKALVAYSRGAFDAGARDVEEAIDGISDLGDRSRLLGVHGMLLHGAGKSKDALSALDTAAVFAASLGAIVDEATYLTGASAAAIDAGRFDEGKKRAERAVLLWDRLGHPERAVRALLAVAASCAAVGRGVDALDAARVAYAEAVSAGDSLAAAYASWAIAACPGVPSGEAREAVLRADRALANATEEDRVRSLSRLLRWSRDEVARSHMRHADRAVERVSATAQWEYWGARAAACLAESNRDEDSVLVLGSLKKLIGVSAPVDAVGPALLEGTKLARALSDGDAARMFEAARVRLRHEVILHLAPQSLDAFAGVAWAQVEHPTPTELSEAQVAQLESLVRSLSARERLRPLLEQVLDALILWSGVDRGLLLMRAPQGTLVPRAARNLARRDLVGDQLSLSMGIAKRALETGEVVVATDAFATLGDLHASVHALKLRSVLAVPLLARGETLGVVYLDDRVRKGAFGEKELAWVKLVASFASSAIVDARDQVLLRRAARKAERMKARAEAVLERTQTELSHTRAEVRRFVYAEIKGTSAPLVEMLRVVDRVTSSEVPVLIFGESGTGKELVARAIHDNGPRQERAFVSENCGALPETLLESTLFGHAKGAFTGANSARAGLFDVADGGTLFLDEIGEMSPAMQTKLLRVLQSGEVRRVGDDRARYVNVRVIAATHRDLRDLVKQGKFRSDLLYRLDVVSVAVPPLRDRPEDIPLLVEHFLSKHGGAKKRSISKAAMDRLRGFRWPGNVRQLENEIRLDLVLSDGDIGPESLSPEIINGVGGGGGAGQGGLREKLDALERDLVADALRKTKGNQTKAAELLGLSRFGLQKMMKRLGIASGG